MSARTPQPSAYNLLELYRQHRDEVDAITDQTCLFLLAFANEIKSVQIDTLAADLNLSLTVLRAKLAPLLRGQLMLEDRGTLVVTSLGRRILAELGFIPPLLPPSGPKQPVPPPTGSTPQTRPEMPIAHSPATTNAPGWLWGGIAFLGTGIIALAAILIVGVVVLSGVFSSPLQSTPPFVATSIPPLTVPLVPSPTPSATPSTTPAPTSSTTPTTTPTATRVGTPPTATTVPGGVAPTATPPPTPTPAPFIPPPPPQNSPIKNGNLIVNGDAEANGQDAATSAQATSQPKNWSQAGDYSATVIRYGATGGFADQNSPGPSNRGNNFFIGGPQRTYAGATQTIDLSNWGADAFALIDASQVAFQFQGWLGGYAGQDDYAELTAVFQNAGLQSPALGKATLTGPNNAVRQGQTGLVFTSTTGVLPAGTRKIVVYMDFYRAAGSGTYDDGMADNLSFTLKGP